MVAEAKEHNANCSDAVAYLMREHDVTQEAAAPNACMASPLTANLQGD